VASTCLHRGARITKASATAAAEAAAQAVRHGTVACSSAERTFAATSGCAEPLAVPVMFESAIDEQPWHLAVQAEQREELMSELHLNLFA